MRAYGQARESTGPCVLLESTTPQGPLARLTLLARDPRAVLIADRAGTTVTTGSGTRAAGPDPVAALRALLRDIPPGRWPHEGGVAGALAYDFVRPQRPAAPTPLLIALAVDRFVVDEVTPAPSMVAFVRSTCLIGRIDMMIVSTIIILMSIYFILSVF